LYLFSQLTLALHHVHSHNILHRDLKTSNILISGSGIEKILKIGDFGISKVLSTKSKAETIVGTPSYLCEGKPYNKKSDVWALGCVLAELACLRKFFDASNLPALILKIMRGAHDPIPPHYSKDLVHLIKSMVNNNPAKRPDMNEIISLPCLQSSIIEAQLSIGRINPHTSPS
jgi:NIMA (never in mitosis gene a)-related kinase 8